MDIDLDRSIDRLAKSEEARTALTGFGTNKQGQAISRRYLGPLINAISANRAAPAIRERPIWRVLKDVRIDDLALRLLVAGITVSYASDLGTDSDGQKNFRDVALWIARNLVSIRDRDLLVRVGEWGVNRLLSLPIFKRGDDDIIELDLTVPLDALLDEVLLRAITTNPLLAPSAKPPEPWTGVRRGGVPAGHWAQPPLIRDHHPSIENAAKKAIGAGRMRPLVNAINALQSVTFSINLPVLQFLRRMGPPSLPPPPDESMTRGQKWFAKKKYSEALAEVTAWELIVATAEALAGEPFPIPLNIDFRGRVNPIPHFNFTRDDRVRGLFLFARGKPAGEQGLRWLKIHVAGRADGVTWSNHQGPRLSELNREERVAWTDANSPLLRKIGAAVLKGEDPAKWSWALPKDDPIQFLAACAELAQAWDNPEFVTRLPLTFDATCSGLQHLCAMTRDEEGGRYVNLTPGEAADDFYRRAAYEVFVTELSRLEEECRGKTGVAVELAKYRSFINVRKTSLGDLKRRPHRIGLDHPFDRKRVKQPAMSYFYGARAGGFQKGKPYGMVKQVIDAGCPTKYAKQSADGIYAAIESMLPRPKAVRDWLEQGARLAAEKEKPLRWQTPLGLTVINIYQPAEIKNISVPMNGRKRNVKLAVGDKDGIRKKKSADAITPNFVHSVDAAHLHLVALAAAKEDIEMVSVHDCFGTLAPDAERLNDIMIDQLIDLHKRYNWLNVIWASAKRDGIKLVPFSDIGTLELEDTRKSFAAYR
jgi:DNA-directed RNA polymerase, mitochondrial